MHKRSSLIAFTYALLGLEKSASAAWALRFARLSPAARARLGQSLRPQTRSTMGKALGEGREKVWFPSATIRDGKAMDSATSVHFDRPTGTLSDGGTRTLKFGELVTRKGPGETIGGASIPEAAGLMRSRPDLFPPVWGTHARGWTVPRLRPVRYHGPRLWTRDQLRETLDRIRTGADYLKPRAAKLFESRNEGPAGKVRTQRHPLNVLWDRLKGGPQAKPDGVHPRPLVEGPDGGLWRAGDFGDTDAKGLLHNIMYYPAERRYVVSDPSWARHKP